MRPFTIVDVNQMVAADKAAIASGVPSIELMENAGGAVAQEISNRYAAGNVLVLCGPGNNGGDGFVIARLLKEQGWEVDVALVYDKSALKGDAATMASRWDGETHSLNTARLDKKTLVVDALFGTGLMRDIDGKIRDMVEAVNAASVPVVAVDIPSGIDGNSGEILGVVVKAELTITFCCKKLGHVLMPGKEYAGEVIAVPIGIPNSVFESLGCHIYENTPELWLNAFPFPQENQHKYSRGHVIVRGGKKEMTGAASMAAKAAARVGAGLVTVACDKKSLPIYATHFLSIMTIEANDNKDFRQLLEDERRNAVLIGPGNGVNTKTKEAVLIALSMQKSCVLDADALTVFANAPEDLYKAIHSPVILTPHEGEFSRLFPILKGDKMSRAKAAAKLSNAVVILKGSDTVIANPEGDVVINTHAPAYLATAGSGDVLAGLAAGLLANKVEPFIAASMAVWLQGEAAKIAGIGMMAQELPDYIPEVLRALYKKAERR